MLDQSCTLTVTTPSGQSGVGVALGSWRRVSPEVGMLEVGVSVSVTDVAEGVAGGGSGVGAVRVAPEEGEGGFPAQAVTSVREISSAKAIEAFGRGMCIF